MRKKIFTSSFLLVCFLFIIPQISFAKVYISEIMYDLEGADTGREWMEIHNDSSEAIDLSKYYIFENNVAHKISFISGSSSIDSGGYAIVTDNSANFMLDFPNFKGNLFDSVFSLNNAGEEIILTDNSKQPVDNLKYDPSLGAEGTGNSLQISEGILIPAEPTPGSINKTEAANESDDTVQDATTTEDISDLSTHSDQNGLSDYKPVNKVKTGIGRDRRISINTDIELEVYKTGEEKGRFVWSFGDGESGKGKKVSHVYKHPGVYNVVLNAYFDGYKTVSRSKIVVDEPQISVDLIDQNIKITNLAKDELNLGDFEILTDISKHKIVKDTILSKGQSVYLELETKPTTLTTLYPNGKKYTYGTVEQPDHFCENLIKQGVACN